MVSFSFKKIHHYWPVGPIISQLALDIFFKSVWPQKEFIKKSPIIGLSILKELVRKFPIIILLVFGPSNDIYFESIKHHCQYTFEWRTTDFWTPTKSLGFLLMVEKKILYLTTFFSSSIQEIFKSSDNWSVDPWRTRREIPDYYSVGQPNDVYFWAHKIWMKNYWLLDPNKEF